MKSVGELLDAARASTGLADFGVDSFREGLERLVAALSAEAQLTAVGEQVLGQRLQMHLEQRLRVEDWYRRHPDIDEVDIVAPLFGVSLPRTGSTALSFLLAADPHARSLRAHESSRPADSIDPSIADKSRLVSARPPGARVFVPTGENPPAECQELMALDFRSQLFLAFARVPGYADWLLEADLTSTYAYEKRVLKLLQWRHPQVRWRLKAPSHLLYLEAIDRVFPDARFVMTHRDPAEVMLSVCTLYAEYVGKLSDHLDPHYIGALNLRQWSTGIARAMAFRANGHDDRFHDIHFRDVRDDPVAAVRRLYAWLDEPVSATFEQNMRDWWSANGDAREPSSYPEPAYFGLDMATVSGAFRDYTVQLGRWAGRAAR